MSENEGWKYTNYVIIAAIIIFAVFCLWIRILPMEALGSTDALNLAGSDDPLYNLRQIEQMTENFPEYGWFEAMTLFPFGESIHWGPLFIWIITGLCLITGATTRPEIIPLALAVPPVMAAFMVPVVFLLVRKISDWKAGLVGAALIAVVSGQYFFRSLFGYLDHHMAEVLFSTIFCLCYIFALAYTRSHSFDWKNFETLKVPVLLGLITGFAYLVGFLTMPTMILFAFIVAVYTVFQFVWDHYQKVRSDYLVLLNVVIFLFTTLTFFLFGPVQEGMQFNFYTIAHPFAFILIIAETLFLYLLSEYLRSRKFYYYPLALLGVIIVIVLGLLAAAPGLYNTLIGAMVEFFGQNSLYLTIQEARSWTIAEAWTTFSYGLILMAGGFLALAYSLWKEKRAEHLFVMIWSLIIVFSTWQHIRYEYYIAVNIAIISAFGAGFILQRSWKDIVVLLHGGGQQKKEAAPVEVKEKEKGKKSKGPQKARPVAKKQVHYVNIGLTVVFFALVVLFAISSVSYEYQVATSGGIRMNQDWRESLEWMGAATPDTGVDYYRIYNEKTFSYPDTAYGVMSWWDYGHMITYIAKRIPNANPFQAGVSGENGAATFFISESEERTNRIADTLGVRYVMTDIEMDTGKFWAMATWYNTSAGQYPYQRQFYVPDPENPGTYGAVTLYTPDYFRTMVSRLHNFDGSMVEPTTGYYIVYSEGVNSVYPLITNAQAMNVADAKAAAEKYNADPASPAGTHAAVMNTGILQPLDHIPALQHYRLVHESPRNVFSQAVPDLKYVKVFEYVPGARIKGDGIIELPLVTNTGRTYVYRQASSNGEFVVPYSTTDSPYDVRATGKYHIEGTALEFDVSEEDVRQGTLIN
jgi:dolichyl-diphosphooligosaccharide--protein glycosyltransferase